MLYQELLAKARGEQKADLVFKNARLVDVFQEELSQADLAVADGVIVGTGSYRGEEEIDLKGQLLAPGLIDGHLHLESAMVPVEKLAATVIPRGTTTVVADPHEIANVAGIVGIKYLLRAGRSLPWNFKMMLPSCVPATPLESSGFKLGARELAPLLKEKGIWGLGEVMDFNSVIRGEEEIWEKILLVGDRFKDGHAPGVSGYDLNAYLLAGIMADHECTTPTEAREKVSKGMYVMIREGSITRDLSNLLPVVNSRNCSRFFFATDDRHPGDLMQEGHLDFLVKKSIAEGLPPLRALRLATINAALALGFRGIGALAPGYQADLLVIEDWEQLKIKQVYQQGKLVAADGQALFAVDPVVDDRPASIFQSVRLGPMAVSAFKLPTGRQFRVMEIIPEKVVTKKGFIWLPTNYNSEDLKKRDLVKLAVVERHHRTGKVGLALLKGFGLTEGAIASSISHDSHNIIVAGLAAEEMLTAVKAVERMQGGIVVIRKGRVAQSLALPVAGLLSEQPLPQVAGRLQEMQQLVEEMGVKVKGAFMMLSFMALPVIPELKLTEQGLYDLTEKRFVTLTID